MTTLLAAAGIAGLGALSSAETARLGEHPEFIDQGTTLAARGVIQGLAGQDATVTLRARGLAKVSCVGPDGSEPPANAGRSVVVTANATQKIAASSIASGSAAFGTTVGPPALGSAASAGCPSNQWTARIDDVDFRSVTVRVVQGGRVVLEQTLRL
jgi:hypothetical protein